MKEHPHAKILRAIADGKNVQSLNESGHWADASLYELAIWPKLKYRVEPETITINGREVPEPVREPSPSAEYWCVDLHSTMFTHRHDFYNDETLKYCLKLGLVHLTREAAIAHAEALLSFTRSDK